MRTPKTFLSAISDSRTAKSALLGLAALGVGGAIVMGSPTAAHAADGIRAGAGVEGRQLRRRAAAQRLLLRPRRHAASR